MNLISSTSQTILYFARKSPWAFWWGFVALLVILAALFAPLLTPYDPYAIDLSKMQAPPDSKNIMGTDSIGRDLYTRLLYGARVSLFVSICSVLLGNSVGAVWGVVSGYLGGKPDLISQRVVEIMLALPGLILAFLIVLIMGANVWSLILSIAFTRIPLATRVIRSVALTTSQNMYIDAARSIGASEFRVMFRHIAPQTFAPFLVLFTIQLGAVIITEASLSYLGLGVAPPTASWGTMLGEASQLLYPLWWHVFFPGAIITIMVLAFNLLGDGLRDEFDPRLRGRT